MKYITNKEYILLDKQKQNLYLINYIEDLISLSSRKQLSSENYDSPGWPYMQAGENEKQKVLNKLLNLIKK